MSKFNKLYEELIKKDHPIFKPASKEELEKRKDTRFQRWLEDEIESGNITKNSDGTYDAKDDVHLSDMNLTKIPIQFNKVNGYFVCSYNDLTSLEGAPKKVNGYFGCSNNKLTSLESAPKEVVINFDCSYNDLTSLKGTPKKVDGEFDCSDQKNGYKFTKEEVKAVCDVKGDIYV